MPVNNNSTHHKIRQLSPGDLLVLPFNDYNKLRTTEYYIRHVYGVNVVHKLIGKPNSPDRKIHVWLENGIYQNPKEKSRIGFSRIKIKRQRDLPFIWVRLDKGDFERPVLIDSGSEITIIDKEFAENLEKKGKVSFVKNIGLSITGIGGKINHDEQIYCRTVLYMKDKKNVLKWLETECMLMDMSSVKSAFNNDIDPIMIIGSDTLQRFNAVIDYNKNEITLQKLTKCKTI